MDCLYLTPKKYIVLHKVMQGRALQNESNAENIQQQGVLSIAVNFVESIKYHITFSHQLNFD